VVAETIHITATGPERTPTPLTVLYSAFGLRIRSNIEIPGFLRVSAEVPADVTVTFGDLPAWLDRSFPPDRDVWHLSPDLGRNGVPSSRVWKVGDGAYFRIFYDDATDCVVDQKGTNVWICWRAPNTVEDVVPYLQGQLLGLVQRLRGMTCLHASSIVVRESAIAIAGPKGSGKSSTAAAFLRMGYPVIADDVTPVYEEAGRFMVHPAHARLWLNPDMVEMLYGSSDALPQSAPSWEKRYLDLNATGPGQPREPKPLGAIYVLAERANEPDRPTVGEAGPHDAMLELLCNTYINHLLDPESRSREFALLSRLQHSVPLRVIRPHGNASRIYQLCEMILENFASLEASSQRGISMSRAQNSR
jgi:hypothetical protein